MINRYQKLSHPQGHRVAENLRPWRSWITQQIPILKNGGSNPFGRAIISYLQRKYIMRRKPYIISRQRYIIEKFIVFRYNQFDK